jgi:hypothetical protein
MLQEVLVYIILALTFGYAIFKLLESFHIIGKKKPNATACSSCSSGACGSCSISSLSGNQPTFPLKVLHEEINK